MTNGFFYNALYHETKLDEENYKQGCLYTISKSDDDRSQCTKYSVQHCSGFKMEIPPEYDDVNIFSTYGPKTNHNFHKFTVMNSYSMIQKSSSIVIFISMVRVPSNALSTPDLALSWESSWRVEKNWRMDKRSSSIMAISSKMNFHMTYPGTGEWRLKLTSNWNKLIRKNW